MESALQAGSADREPGLVRAKARLSEDTGGQEERISYRAGAAGEVAFRVDDFDTARSLFEISTADLGSRNRKRGLSLSRGRDDHGVEFLRRLGVEKGNKRAADTGDREDGSFQNES